MTTTGKTCFKCGATKDRAEFYRHEMMADGLLGKCKDCARADVRSHRRDPRCREKLLAYDRKRGNRQAAEYAKKLKLLNPVAEKARTTLSNAVRDGRIVRPSRCEHCGKEDRLHGHHHDYSKPLAVVWLCVACHRQHHALMNLINSRMKDDSATTTAKVRV